MKTCVLLLQLAVYGVAICIMYGAAIRTCTAIEKIEQHIAVIAAEEEAPSQ